MDRAVYLALLALYLLPMLAFFAALAALLLPDWVWERVAGWWHGGQ